LEKRGELRQRIVGADVTIKLPLVIDKITRYLKLLFADAIQRFDLTGVHNRRIQTGFHCVMKKNRVEDDARRRIQAEGNIRHAEDGVAAGQFSLDALDA